MPQATLTFAIDDFHEKIHFERATKALELCSVIWDMEQELRRKLKYEEHSDETFEQLEKLRDFLHNCLDDNSLNLDLTSVSDTKSCNFFHSKSTS